MQAAPVVAALDEFLDPLGQMLHITVVLRKNLVVLGFRLLFTPLLPPVDIRDADRQGQGFLPLGDQGSGMPGPRLACGRSLL